MEFASTFSSIRGEGDTTVEQTLGAAPSLQLDDGDIRLDHAGSYFPQQIMSPELVTPPPLPTYADDGDDGYDGVGVGAGAGANVGGVGVRRGDGREGRDSLRPSLPSSPSPERQQRYSEVAEDLDVSTTGVIEETLEKLSRLHGVLGIVIVDGEGVVIRTTMPPRDAARYARAAVQLQQRTRSVVSGLMPGDPLQLLCVRTKRHEMLVCGADDDGFITLVVQNPYA